MVYIYNLIQAARLTFIEPIGIWDRLRVSAASLVGVELRDSGMYYCIFVEPIGTWDRLRVSAAALVGVELRDSGIYYCICIEPFGIWDRLRVSVEWSYAIPV